MWEDEVEYALDYGKSLDAEYSDIRIEDKIYEGVISENGEVKNAYTMRKMSFGIRVLCGGSWGFYGSDFNSERMIKKEIIAGIKKAVKSAKAVSKYEKIELAEVKTHQDKIDLKKNFVKKMPIDFEKKMSEACEITKRMIEKVNMAVLRLGHEITKKYLATSEGTRIYDEYMYVGGSVYSFAHSEKGHQSYWMPYGARGGWEYIESLDLEKFSYEIAERTINLLEKGMTPKSRDTVVVTTPHFNTLKVHEIVGHPTEADRILGGESAWAGRAWWKSLIGKKVGSELVNAVSDARPIKMHAGAYGTFYYDDEGVKSSKVVHIENGVLREFLHSRQTASIMGVKPNGGMRAISASMMPIIRMTNTYFEPNKDGPNSIDEMVEDIKRGILVGNHSIPSIDSRRYRWQINAYEAWEIKNGEIKNLLKNVAIIGNTEKYFKSIFLVGGPKTLKIYPIPNCGKGDPIQIQRVGNGGPLMAGIARIVGGV